MSNKDFSVIHIFGFGSVQILGKKINKIFNSQSMNRLKPLVDNIFSKKPIDNDSTQDFHIINICNERYVEYITNSDDPKIMGKSFKLDYKEIDINLIYDLISEMYLKS